MRYNVQLFGAVAGKIDKMVKKSETDITIVQIYMVLASKVLQGSHAARD